MTVLLVGEKCSCTPSTLRFFASLRLALEQNCLFLDGHKMGMLSHFRPAPYLEEITGAFFDSDTMQKQTTSLFYDKGSNPGKYHQIAYAESCPAC